MNDISGFFLTFPVTEESCCDVTWARGRHYKISRQRRRSDEQGSAKQIASDRERIN